MDDDEKSDNFLSKLHKVKNAPDIMPKNSDRFDLDQSISLPILFDYLLNSIFRMIFWDMKLQ